MASFFLLVALLWPSSSQNWQTIDMHQSDSTLTVNQQFVKECQDAWVGHDKFLHCATSTALSGFAYYYMLTHTEKSACRARAYALSFAACAGLGKELYDLRTNRCFSWKDLLWNGVGLTVSFFAFMR